MGPALLYDADCAFCTRSAGVLRRLGVRAAVQSLQSVDLEAHGVDVARAQREVPFVGADGSVVYGHVAIAAALRTGVAPLRLLGMLITTWPISVISSRVYRWVASHRHELLGGTAQCAIDPAIDPVIDSAGPPSG